MPDEQTPEGATATTEPQPSAPTRSPAEIQADLQAAIAARDAAKQRARAIEAEAAELRAFKEKQEAEAAKAEEDKRRQQLEQEGEYQKALKEAKDKQAAELEAIRKRAERALVPTAIQAAAAKLENLAPGAASDLPSLIGHQIGIDPETFLPYVKDAEGKPMKDPETLKLMEVDAFIGKFVSERDYLKVDRQVVGQGVKPGAQDVPTEAFTVQAALADPKVMRKWEETDPDGCEKAFNEYYSAGSLAKRAQERMKRPIEVRP
jgi:hypothetical protein